jgi:hypothetical protein
MIRHIKTHGLRLTKDKVNQFNQALSQLDVSATANIPAPNPRGPPVEGLIVKPKGHCCNHCNYCTPTFGGFKKHWSLNHREDDMPTSAAYHHGFIQTFFDPSPQRWFEVLPPAPTPLPNQDLFAAYLESQVPQFKSTLISGPVRAHEVPPLLQFTRWHVHLANFIKTQEGVRDITSLVQVPSPKQTKGLGALRDIVFNYMKDIRAKADASTIGVKCLLMESSL